MTALRVILTDAGRGKLIDAAAGGTGAVVIAEAGFTAQAFVAAPTLTALPGEFKRVDAVSGQAVDAATLHLTVRDTAAELYTVRGIGLYLDDGTLFAVYAQPTPIFEKAEVATFFLAIDLTFADGDVDLITFGNTNFLNPPATEEVMGVARFASAVEALAGLVANKMISPATMATVLEYYVANDRLGVADGVATLGPDGKLALAQRPPIDLIDVFAVANEAAMLALAATPGDFAVRADTGLVFVLQAAPATVLGNWLEISTPAPVSSVNAKVGAVVLNANDVGAVPVARRVDGAGLLAGQGGGLGANLTFTLTAASAAEALAGLLATKVLTPQSLTDLIALVNLKASAGVSVTGGGLIEGGGALTADRVLSLLAATAAEIADGTIANKAVTPAALADLPKSLTPNGYFMWPGGFMMQWIQYRFPFTSEAVVLLNYPLTFTEVVLPVMATGWLAAPNNFKDLYPQAVAPDLGSCQVQLQSPNSNDKRLDGFDLIVFGK